ncbi:unnamed protein product [Pleuronectes platessa]|uniref:Uncharacterized protein n=1 Tax=Pleuronectes platessa TaxID=8262 RepID=A0A9N7Y755_PLEPL|nr:unnamed protein product [Pleuronectes platessa]
MQNQSEPETMQDQPNIDTEAVYALTEAENNLTTYVCAVILEVFQSCKALKGRKDEEVSRHTERLLTLIMEGVPKDLVPNITLVQMARSVFKQLVRVFGRKLKAKILEPEPHEESTMIDIFQMKLKKHSGEPATPFRCSLFSAICGVIAVGSPVMGITYDYRVLLLGLSLSPRVFVKCTVAAVAFPPSWAPPGSGTFSQGVAKVQRSGSSVLFPNCVANSTDSSFTEAASFPPSFHTQSAGTPDTNYYKLFTSNLTVFEKQYDDSCGIRESELHEGLSAEPGEEVPRQRRRSYLSVSVKTEKHTLACVHALRSWRCTRCTHVSENGG